MGREEDRPSRGKGLPSPSPSPGTHALCLLTEHFLAHIVDLISALTEGTRHPGASVPMLRLFHHLDYTSVPSPDSVWILPVEYHLLQEGLPGCLLPPLEMTLEPFIPVSPGVFLQPLTLPAQLTPPLLAQGGLSSQGLFLNLTVLDPDMLTNESSHRSVPQKEQQASNSGDSEV